MGIANGKSVHFVAIATHHPSPTGDWFKISWGGGPGLGIASDAEGPGCPRTWKGMLSAASFRI